MFPFTKIIIKTTTVGKREVVTRKLLLDFDLT